MMESVVRLATTANYLLLVSAFCPGLAMLRFAKKSNWSIVPTMAAVILILVPATVIASSHHLLDPTWKEIHHEVAYAVWPLPGVIVLLNKWSKKGPRLGATSSVLYVLPYLVASIPLYFFGMRSLANPTVSCIAAIVVILFFRSDKLLFAARSVGVVLLLLPVAAPFLVRLPEHVAMAKACESEAGTSINVTPVPTDVIALELGQDGCDRLCRELLKTKSVAAVETSWMGGGTGTMSHPAGLYRYEFGPFISSGATPSAQGEDDRFCYQQITWGGVPDCIFAMLISDYAARYAIGLGGGVPKPESIREDSFEIVDRKNGEVVAWTKAYFMIDTWLDVLFDIPLAPIADLRHRCQENGPGLKPLLSEFLRSPRSDGPRRFNNATR